MLRPAYLEPQQAPYIPHATSYLHATCYMLRATSYMLHATCYMLRCALRGGGVQGTSPLTVMSETAVGIKEGGRTGLTALVVAFGFGISMFFSPIFSNIPGYATGGWYGTGTTCAPSTSLHALAMHSCAHARTHAHIHALTCHLASQAPPSSWWAAS